MTQRLGVIPGVQRRTGVARKTSGCAKTEIG
jgi:hypothetical protein